MKRNTFSSLKFSFSSRPSKGAEQRQHQNKWRFLTPVLTQKKVLVSENSNGKISTLCCLNKSQISSEPQSSQKLNEYSMNSKAVIPLIQLQPVQEGIEHISVLTEGQNGAKCHFCNERCDKVHSDNTRLKIMSRGNYFGCNYLE